MVSDCFEKGLEIKYEGINDPYLAEILKLNRHDRTLHSILSSVQENQFKINLHFF